MLDGHENIVLRHTDDGADPCAASVRRHLTHDNTTRLGIPRDAQALGVYATTPNGALAGGLVGDTVWGWLNTSLLWVAQEARGQGLGKRLLRHAEQVARARGMRWARVKTTGFQARGFYTSMGYTVFAELPILVQVRGAPQESVDIYLSKNLSA